MIVDSLVRFKASSQPARLSQSQDPPPNAHNHSARYQLVLHSASLTLFADAPLAFVALAPVSTAAALVDLPNRVLFHSSAPLASISVDLVCARTWSAAAGSQKEARVGALTVENESFPLGHPARYLVRVFSRQHAHQVDIGTTSSKEQREFGLFDVAVAPTALLFRSFGWSADAMRSCDSSRVLPSDPFHPEMSGSRFEHLPRSPLLSMHRVGSEQSVRLIPSHLLFSEVKTVLIDSLSIHWQRDTLRSIQNLFLFDLSLCGSALPNMNREHVSIARTDSADLLQRSKTREWQEELNSIFVALTSKIEGVFAPNVLLQNAVHCFDSVSSRVCLVANSVSVDLYRTTAAEPSPDTTFPPLPALTSPSCLSTQGASKFQNILLRAWPLHPLFPSAPLNFHHLPLPCTSNGFSAKICAQLASSLCNGTELPWQWSWGLKTEHPFARFEWHSQSTAISTDSRLGRVQLQLGMRVTDVLFCLEPIHPLFCV